MRFIRLAVIAALGLCVSCSFADFAQMFKNVNLEKQGINLKLVNVPKGLYQTPFIIQFDKMLSDISDGEVQIKAYNVFTVGNYDKISPQSIKDVTNFLDPTCKFKDTWFGVYIVMDDSGELGRNFILKDPSGKPDDLNNLKDRSLLMLPELDQKIILWSSHQHQSNYSWEQFKKEFHFPIRKGTALKTEIVTDKQGRSWYKITGEFDTNSALTDTALSDMSLFTSIRSYIGLPNAAVYARVPPWHDLIIKGSIMTRYFKCNDIAFWAVVYYNGGAYYDKTGRFVDNWKTTDLRMVLDKMFQDLQLDCVQK